MTSNYGPHAVSSYVLENLKIDLGGKVYDAHIQRDSSTIHNRSNKLKASDLPTAPRWFHTEGQATFSQGLKLSKQAGWRWSFVA